MSAANILNSPITGAPAITTPYASGGGGGPGVSSVNGATGAITVAAGSGIGVATVGTTVTITNTGGGGGLFLPLAGGTMDALPAGVINAHTIVGPAGGILSLDAGALGDVAITATNGNAGMSGDTANVSSVNGTDINSTGGGNVGIDTTGQVLVGSILTPSSISMTIGPAPVGPPPPRAAAFTVTTDVAEPIGLEMNGAVKIQPVPGYIYPDNAIIAADVNVGLQIKDWANTNLVAPGSTVVQAGIGCLDISSLNGPAYGMVMDTITSTNDGAIGIQCGTITAATTAYGILANTVTSSAGAATGMALGTITGDNNATGMTINGVNATTNPIGQALGMQIDSVNGSADTYGLIISTVNSTTQKAEGIFVAGVNGALNAIGIQAISVTGGDKSTGIDITNIQGGTGDSIGMNLGGIVGTGSSAVYGVYLNSMTGLGAGAVNGMFIDNVTGASAVGEKISIVSASTSTATGVEIDSITGVTNTNGIKLLNVTSSTANAVGVDALVIAATAGDATGIRTKNVVGSTAATGVAIQEVSTTNPASPAYGLLATKAPLKGLNDAGVLMRLITGNLGLAVQNVNISNPNVYGDNGNLVVIEVSAAANITLNEPTGGWLAGHWYLFSKQGAGAHTLTSTGAGNVFNSVAGPFTIGGGANSMCLIFYTGTAVGWAAHVF